MLLTAVGANVNICRDSCEKHLDSGHSVFSLEKYGIPYARSRILFDFDICPDCCERPVDSGHALFSLENCGIPYARSRNLFGFGICPDRREKKKFKNYEKKLNMQNQKQEKNKKVKFNFAKSDGGPTRRHLTTNNLRECSL